MDKIVIQKELEEICTELLEEEDNKTITNPIEKEFLEGKKIGLQESLEEYKIFLNKCNNATDFSIKVISFNNEKIKDLLKKREEFSGTNKEKGILFGHIAFSSIINTYLLDLGSRLAKEAYMSNNK
jgi:hypothetical protein